VKGIFSGGTRPDPAYVSSDEEDDENTSSDEPDEPDHELGYDQKTKEETVLRFAPGGRVTAYLAIGDQKSMWHPGVIVACFPEAGGQPSSEDQRFYAYSIQLDNGIGCFAPLDSNQFVRKGKPPVEGDPLGKVHGYLSVDGVPTVDLRFSVGQRVLANVGCDGENAPYHFGHVTQVRNKPHSSQALFVISCFSKLFLKPIVCVRLGASCGTNLHTGIASSCMRHIRFC
jgi:hypothetical protein